MLADRSTLVLAIALLTGPLGAGAASTASDPGADGTAGDRWVVGFHDLQAADVDDGDWRGHAVLDVNDAIGFAVVEVQDPVSFQLEDRHSDNVAYTERDDPTQFQPLFTPDDPRYGDQYGFPQINAPSAWDTTLGSADVSVSVIDTGIDQDHEDLQGTVAAQRDFVEDDGTADDDCGHGTHVAGTVSANTDNGVGVAGTAGGVQLLIAKALSNSLLVQCTGSSSDIADAITWSTDNGADVLSMSLGGTSESSTIGEAVDYAWENGVLIVAAAGNDGQCTDCVSYPAARDRVVAVTCTNSNEEQCSFSSQGPEAELAAPGNDVLSTCLGSDYCQKSGTSMSTPHVSGVAGLALSVDPSLTNTELRDLMNQTAQDLGSDGHDNVYGHGEVDAAALLDSVDSTANEAPSASFEANCSDLTCEFDASGSSDNDGSVSSYDWEFGDGTTGTGEVVNHTYDAEGTYTVNLTVADDDGATNTTSQDVSVSTSNSAPTADFTSSCTDLACQFDASGSSDSDGSISSYDWEFGDGATGTGEVVNHTYETGGDYQVNLTVTDDDGATDTTSQTVSVSGSSTSALLSEDFDDGSADGFALSGLWHVSDVCATPPTTPNYLGYNQDPDCTYDTGSQTSGEARVAVDLSGVSQAELSFQHRWETESTTCGLISCAEYDVMRVQVSTDGGGSWTTLDEWTSLDDNQLSWTNASYDLSEFTGGTADLRFTFDSGDSASNDFEGWLVDDVQVTET